MSRVCEICGRKTSFGNTLKRRGKAKHLGGVGQKITGKSKRRFKPNLQYVSAEVNGGAKRMRVCMRCLRAGKVKKFCRVPPTTEDPAV